MREMALMVNIALSHNLFIARTHIYIFIYIWNLFWSRPYFLLQGCVHLDNVLFVVLPARFCRVVSHCHFCGCEGRIGWLRQSSFSFLFEVKEPGSLRNYTTMLSFIQKCSWYIFQAITKLGQ